MAKAVGLPVLNQRFVKEQSYAAPTIAGYELLPLRFIELDTDRYVLSNFAGEYVVLPRETLHAFIRHELPSNHSNYEELKSKHFLFDGDSTVGLDLLAVKYRTKQNYLAHSTSLFLFIVSLRCDHSCPYCQVSRQSADRHAFDMRTETADQAIELMFRSPSPQIKVEFQGGEPLLNFELIQYIVWAVEARNQLEEREVQFVIATTLVFLTDEILDFCAEHEIFFSTSLDGPRELHNHNRPRPGGDSYEMAVAGIKRVREQLGPDHVAALMTTTEASLSQPQAIVDEYLCLGFDSIFLRPISPYGFAAKTGHAWKYDADRWLSFYREALDHILEINAQGVNFREEYTALLLRKILTPYATGYVDLQSPAGMGISCLVFNYDGDIYASDEARMLAEMGDFTFRLGNVTHNSYEEVMLSPVLLDTLSETMTEGMPMCTDCGFQPYCGSDPVQHHVTQGDTIGNKPTSAFCRRNMEVMRHIFQILQDDPQSARILRSWI